MGKWERSDYNASPRILDSLQSHQLTSCHTLHKGVGPHPASRLIISPIVEGSSRHGNAGGHTPEFGILRFSETTSRERERKLRCSMRRILASQGLSTRSPPPCAVTLAGEDV